MNKTLLFTTALASLVTPAYLQAADINITEDKTITQTGVVVDDAGVITDFGTVKDGIVQSENNDINIQGGTITVNTMFAGISHMADGDINISEGATIIGGSIEGRIPDEKPGEFYTPLGNTIVHSGNGNINIKGGSLQLNNAGIMKVNRCENGGYGLGCEGEEIEATGNINISGGKLVLSQSENYSEHNINISGGNISMSQNSDLSANEKITISDGKIQATDSSMHGNGISVTGGEITLDNTDFTNDSLSETFKLSGGTITMNGNQSVIGTNHGDVNDDTSGKFEMSGGHVVVNNSENYIEGGDISVSGGDISISKGATLQTVATLTENDMPKDISTIKLTDAGTINLSGKLVSNISGNGNITFQNSASNITGNVAGSHLTFEADHSLSQAISGGISNLASLSVNKGTLTYDKPSEGLLGDVKVAQGAGLNVNKFMQTNDLTLNGKVSINDDVAAQGNIKIADASIDLNGKSLNAIKEGITMTSGTINMNNGSGNQDLTLWAAKDINISGGTINMNGREAYIDTFYDLLDQNHKPLPKPGTPGNINISNATINVNSNSAEISSEGEINVSDNAVINIASGAKLSSYESFKIENADLVLGDKATINLTGTGAINIAGNLAANVEGDGNLNIKSSNAVINGDIKGSQLTFEADHSLSKALLGENIELASLNVNKGTLTFDEQPTSITNLNVAGGLDIGANTVKATNVSFKDNSTLKFTVAGKEDGSYGKIKADTINVSTTGTKLDLTLNSSVLGKDESKDFTILDGSVTGDFAELSKNSRYEFEKLGNGQYKITGKASAADIATEAGGSANNVGTATAWDGVSLDNPSGSTSGQVANALAELAGKPDAASQKAYVDALTAVAPEVAPMVQQNETQTSNQVFGAIGTRLSGGSISTGGEGMSSGDNIFERAAMWVQGLFNKSKLDDTSKSYGFDADSNGIAMGAEKYVTEDTKVGLGYAYTNTDIDGFKRETDVDTHTAFVYGEYKPSNWYVNGIASYGWSDYDESKNVAGVNVKSDYDAETFGLQAMTGYDMQVKGFGLTPEMGLRYVHISQDSYKDSADQRVSANDSDILTGVIGAKVSKTWTLENGMNIKPEARIAATYDLMNDDTNSVVTLANGSAYSVEGEALDRFGMEFGAGLTAEINDNVELSLGYEGKFREDYQDHTGLLNAKYKF